MIIINCILYIVTYPSIFVKMHVDETVFVLFGRFLRIGYLVRKEKGPDTDKR